MEIKVAINKRVFSLSIGHKTQWFEQVPLFLLTEEFYDNQKVWFARLVWKAF